MTKQLRHSITPTDRGMPRPDKDGIYPAATWRLSNPDYRPGKNDAGRLYDYVTANPDVRKLPLHGGRR